MPVEQAGTELLDVPMLKDDDIDRLDWDLSPRG